MTSMAPSRPVHARTSRALTCIALAALALAAVPAALAKESDRNQPVQVDANSFDAINQPNGVSHLKGDVRIVQGTLHADGDSATVYFDAHSQVRRVVLTGRPAHLSQEDDHGNQVRAHADTIDYDVSKGVARLTGDASVRQQGRGEAHGDELVYNTRTSQMRGQSQGDHRVHLVFQAKQAPAPAPASSAPAAASPTAPAAASSAPAPATSAPAPASTQGQP